MFETWKKNTLLAPFEELTGEMSSTAAAEDVIPSVMALESLPRTDRAETSLFDIYNEILVENETTEQMKQHSKKVKVKGFDYVLLVIGTYVNANKITFWSVLCV
jgi:bacterioferritin (cytochrome b1)